MVQCFWQVSTALFFTETYQKGNRMRIKMLHTIQAAPDHNHTREYAKGEVYEIDTPNEKGEVFMPSWLADVLVVGGYTYFKPVPHTTNEGRTHVAGKEAPAALLVK
jgi:hypothetical protein